MTADVPPLLVRALGVVVAIAAPDEETRERLARQWSRAVVVEPDQDPVATVDVPKGVSDSVAGDYGLTTRVTLAALKATAGKRVNLHAGGVADEQGRLLALVAASGTGKTTATRVLSSRLGYVTDETVSIDPDGAVHAYPKPLSVIVDPASKFRKEQLSPDDLSLLPAPETTTLARLVILERGADGPPGLRTMRTAEAVLQLVEQSSSLSQLPRPLRTLVDLVHRCGGVRGLTYTEIEEHVDDLVALLEAREAPADSKDLVWHDGLDEFPLLGSEGPFLARRRFVEAVEIGDELVVLTRSQAWLLADLTAAIWLELAQPSTLTELVTAAQTRFGAHDDAEAVVRAAVSTLVDEGLVAWGELESADL